MGVVHASTHGIQEMSDLLELQDGVRHLTQVLGTELGSSAIILYALNTGAMFPVTTVFKSNMLNGRTGGKIKGVNSPSPLQWVMKRIKVPLLPPF